MAEIKLKYCTEYHASALMNTALNAAREEDPQGPKNKALWHYAGLALSGHREHAEAMLLAFKGLAQEGIIPPPAMLNYFADAVLRHFVEGVSLDDALGLKGKKPSEGLNAFRSGTVTGAVNKLWKEHPGLGLKRICEILEKEGTEFPSVKEWGKEETLSWSTIKSIYLEAKKQYKTDQEMFRFFSNLFERAKLSGKLPQLEKAMGLSRRIADAEKED